MERKSAKEGAQSPDGYDTAFDLAWRRLFLKWPLHDIAGTPVAANANTTAGSVSFNYSNGAPIIVIMEEPVRTSSLH